MPVFPEEIDLLSLFECEPILLDKSEDLPFYYNEASYHFNNKEEEFHVTISPSYGEVQIEVKERTSQDLIALFDLKRVGKFEIIEDKKETSSILLTINNEETQQTIELGFKPKFKVVFMEYLTR